MWLAPADGACRPLAEWALRRVPARRSKWRSWPCARTCSRCGYTAARGGELRVSSWSRYQRNLNLAESRPLVVWWAVGKVTFEPKRQGGACAYEHKAPRVQARPNLHGPCTRSPGTTHVQVKLKNSSVVFLRSRVHRHKEQGRTVGCEYLQADVVHTKPFLHGIDFTLGLFMGAIAIPRDKRNRQPSRRVSSRGRGLAQCKGKELRNK
jgi:hypothetical protein